MAGFRIGNIKSILYMFRIISFVKNVIVGLDDAADPEPYNFVPTNAVTDPQPYSIDPNSDSADPEPYGYGPAYDSADPEPQGYGPNYDSADPEPAAYYDSADPEPAAFYTGSLDLSAVSSGKRSSMYREDVNLKKFPT